MIRGVMLAVVVVAASVGGAGVASADGNESPLAGAGLDQTVSDGTVVYLDAGGSVDPDGSIERYRWQITAPNGTTLSPACGSCVQTHFRANQSGEYAVTVTVTDDDGATASDTLYVTAKTSEPPTVSVTGPAVVQNGETASFDATVTAGDSELDTLVWSLNGSEVAREPLSGTEAERELETAISDLGSRTVRARAVDVGGNSGSGTHIAYSVTESAGDNLSVGPTGSGSPGGDPFVYTPMIERTGNDGAYHMYLRDDGTFVAGSNSDVTLDQEAIDRLAKIEGVTLGEVHVNTGPTDALIINNPRIKDNLDKDAGQKGFGIRGEMKYTNPNSDYEYQSKWQLTSPGGTWKKVDTRTVDTHIESSRTNKPGWVFEGIVAEPTDNTYPAWNAKKPIDERVGAKEITETYWSDSPSDGTVIDTKRSVSHYTYEQEVTRTKRVRVGKEKVGEKKIYGFKTVKKTKTGCDNSLKSPITGVTVCTDNIQPRQTYTTREWGVVDTKPIYDTTYNTRRYTTTVTKRSTSYPYYGQNVETHYTTQYKIQNTKYKPLWQEHEPMYKYTQVMHKWVRDG